MQFFFLMENWFKKKGNSFYFGCCLADHFENKILWFISFDGQIFVNREWLALSIDLAIYKDISHPH